MVQAGTDDVHILFVLSKSLGNLAVAVLYAVAEAVGGYLAVFVCRPGHHGVGIGIVEHDAAFLGNLPDVLAEFKDGADSSLAIHNTADAQSVAHALIHPVFQGNFHVCCKPLQHTDPHTVNHVSGIAESFSSIRSCLNLDRESVGINITLAKLRDHPQILFINVRKGYFNILKLRYGQNIRE